MQPEQLLAQRVHALVRRLDHQQLLIVAGHAPFPAIDRMHAIDDVHACRETSLDQRVREVPRVKVRADGRQHQQRLHSPRTVAETNDAASRATFLATLRCCARSIIGIAMYAKIEPPPIPTPVGMSAVELFLRSFFATSSIVSPSYTRSS